MKDIVQIQMDPSNNEHINHSQPKAVATLQTGNVKINIQNGIDKYILYIILKELKDHAS